MKTLWRPVKNLQTCSAAHYSNIAFRFCSSMFLLLIKQSSTQTIMKKTWITYMKTVWAIWTSAGCSTYIYLIMFRQPGFFSNVDSKVVWHPLETLKSTNQIHVYRIKCQQHKATASPGISRNTSNHIERSCNPELPAGKMQPTLWT